MSVSLPCLYHPKVEVDWLGDGLYASPVSDVTRDTLGDPGLTIDTGRDGSRALSPPKVPAASFELRNDHGRYSNENGASPVYQLVRPGTPVRISATFGTPRLYRSPIAYRAPVPYRGIAFWMLGRTRIDQTTQETALGSQRVAVDTLGESSTLVGMSVTVPLQTAIRTDQAITMILDAAGWPADRRAIAPGDSTLLYWWADGRSAWDALMEVTSSEGPATLYEDADGVLHWEGRNYRAVTPRAMVPQAAFFDQRVSGGHPYRAARLYRHNSLYRGNQNALYFQTLTYAPGWRQLYSRATYTTRRRTLGTLGVVWQYGADLTLAAGASRTLFARPANPFQSAVTPVAGPDYQFSGSAPTITLDASSGFVGIITITAGASGTTITGPAATPTGGLQFRAQPLTVVSETVVQSSLDPSDSEQVYGAIQTLDVAGWPEIDPAMAEGVCNAWVQRYSVQRPQVTIAVRAVDAEHFRQIVQRGVSDRISLRSTSTGVSGDVWIESRQIVAAGAGGRHLEAIWQCEKVDTVSGFLWDAANSFWDIGPSGEPGARWAS
jgi:hypothetical protein